MFRLLLYVAVRANASWRCSRQKIHLINSLNFTYELATKKYKLQTYWQSIYLLDRKISESESEYFIKTISPCGLKKYSDSNFDVFLSSSIQYILQTHST